MTDCPHTPKYPDLSEIPTFQEAMSCCSLVEGDKAVADQHALTNGPQTRIDAIFWRGLSDAQKTAVVAHERAHPAIDMANDCEGCADKVGGYYMRVWGYCVDDIGDSFGSFKVKRKPEHGVITANALTGAKAAERALASRGLLGRSSAVVSKQLAAEKIAATVRRTTADTSNPADKTVADVKPTSAAAPVSTGLASSQVTAVQVRGADASASSIALAPVATTAAETVPPLTSGSTEAVTETPQGESGSDVAGDAVAFVLGEDARPHSRKVLLAAGVAAILAVVLVVVVRRK